MGNISSSEKRRIPIYNDPEQAMAGRVEVDSDKCTGCGFCVKICPTAALVMENKLPKMVPPGLNECMGCGDCMPICPTSAMVLIKGNEFTGCYKTIDRGDLMFPRL